MRIFQTVLSDKLTCHVLVIHKTLSQDHCQGISWLFASCWCKRRQEASAVPALGTNHTAIFQGLIPVLITEPIHMWSCYLALYYQLRRAVSWYGFCTATNIITWGHFHEKQLSSVVLVVKPLSVNWAHFYRREAYFRQPRYHMPVVIRSAELFCGSREAYVRKLSYFVIVLMSISTH
jgi:hypothetical protein